MEVFNFILITLFAVVSTIGLAKEHYKDYSNPFKLIFFTIITLSCLISIVDASTKLRDKDVFEGRAEYVETIHISKGDTIKTYHIQPKEKK